MRIEMRQVQAHVEFELVVLRLHARAQRIESLVVLAHAKVREFVHAQFAALPYVPQLGHTEFHPEFTRRVAARGWIGMTWPKRYGGQDDVEPEDRSP